MNRLSECTATFLLRQIVLIEDDLLLADLLRVALGRRFAQAAIRTYATGDSGCAACMDTAPDVLICDLRLPDMDARDVVRRLRTAGRTTRVVVLTTYGDAELPAELVALGVAGYVDKSLPLSQVEQAVERVWAGGMYYHGAHAGPRASVAALRDNRPDPRKLAALTPRQREVLRLVAGGLSSKEIGCRLELSPRTVEKIRLGMMESLGLPNAAALVRWGLECGLDLMEKAGPARDFR